jgi:hypothetical protein
MTFINMKTEVHGKIYGKIIKMEMSYSCKADVWKSKLDTNFTQNCIYMFVCG